MSIEVHIDWQGRSHRVGGLDAPERSTSVSFEYSAEWLQRPDAFAIDPTSLPLQRGDQHGKSLFDPQPEFVRSLEHYRLGSRAVQILPG